MPSFTFKLRLKALLLLSCPLMLTACGDGWEMVSYGGFPYSNARTAGNGIAYVRASLLPKHGTVLKAAQPENKEMIENPAAVMEPVEAEGVLKALDKAFNKALRK